MPMLTKRCVMSFWLIASTLIIGGCGLKPVQYTPTQAYVLNPTLPAVIPQKATALTLLVSTPKASQAFDTNEMVYIDKQYQLNYFSYNNWADTPAQMLQPLLVQALQNTGHFHAVISTPGNVNYNIVLKTQILQLQQSFLTKPSQVQFNVRAQLINTAAHQVIATQQFNITEPAEADTPYGGVIAANKATAKLLQELAGFCLDNTQLAK